MVERKPFTTTEVIESILNTVISVNQLSIHGAVADLCNEFLRCSTSSAQANLLQDYFTKFAELLGDQKIVETLQRCWFLQKDRERTVHKITSEEGPEVVQTACREYTQPRNLTTSRPRGWISSNTQIGPVLDEKLYPHEARCCIDRTVSWVRISHCEWYQQIRHRNVTAQGNLWQRSSQDQNLL